MMQATLDRINRGRCVRRIGPSTSTVFSSLYSTTDAEERAALLAQILAQIDIQIAAAWAKPDAETALRLEGIREMGSVWVDVERARMTAHARGGAA